jgi:hypothetical protein
MKRATTWAPSCAAARRVASRLNRRLSPSSRKRIRYTQGRYGVFGDECWCVWRSIKTRDGWMLTGVVDWGA